MHGADSTRTNSESGQYRCVSSFFEKGCSSGSSTIHSVTDWWTFIDWIALSRLKLCKNCPLITPQTVRKHKAKRIDFETIPKDLIRYRFNLRNNFLLRYRFILASHIWHKPFQKSYSVARAKMSEWNLMQLLMWTLWINLRIVFRFGCELFMLIFIFLHFVEMAVTMMRMMTMMVDSSASEKARLGGVINDSVFTFG